MGNSQLDAIEEMALQNGTYIVNDATEYTNDIDIAPVRGVSFSALQLTSGSVVAILK